MEVTEVLDVVSGGAPVGTGASAFDWLDLAVSRHLDLMCNIMDPPLSVPHYGPYVHGMRGVCLMCPALAVHMG